MLEDKLPLTRMLCGYFEDVSQMVLPILDTLPDALVISAAEDPGYSPLVQLLIDEATQALPGRQVVIDLLAEVVFVHALRTYIASGAASGVLALLGKPLIGAVLGQLHRHPEANWTVASMAGLAQMSRASFSAKFKAAVNDTPVNYLAKWRMQVAVDALKSTERSVAQIAEEVGYSSEAAFRNAFKHWVGQTPGEVRRPSASV